MATVMRRKKPFLIGAALVLLVIVGIFMFGENVYGKKLEEHINKGEKIEQQLEQYDRNYRAAQRERRAAEEQVEALTKRQVDRDVLLRVVPALAQTLPEDTIYVNTTRFRWMSRGAFNRRAKQGPEGGEEEEEEARPRPSPDGGSGGMPYGGPPGMPGGYPGGPGGPQREPEPQEAEPETGGKGPVLALELSCQSTVVREGQKFFRQKVLQPLRETRSARDGRKIFSQVRVLGSPKSIFRRASDGKVVENPGADAEVIEFVAFSLLAEVNIGSKEEESE